MNFEAIKNHGDLQTVSREAIWQDFEELAAYIFSQNDFQVQIRKVKRSKKKRRQYDVIAKKGSRTILAECKKWSGNRHRLSALRAAVRKHWERSEFYRTLTDEAVFPIIVTLLEEEIQLYEGMPVVPICKLNSFLNEEDAGLCQFEILAPDPTI